MHCIDIVKLKDGQYVEHWRYGQVVSWLVDQLTSWQVNTLTR
jgi:hypothetical protein